MLGLGGFQYSQPKMEVFVDEWLVIGVISDSFTLELSEERGI